MFKERIQQDLNAALKEKRETEVSVLRLLSAAILNKEKEKRYKLKEEKDTPLTDEEIVEVIVSEVKKRKEATAEFAEAALHLSPRSNSAFEKGKIEGLIAKEKQELEILQKYLPEQLSEEEIKKLAKEAMEKTGAKEMKDMGKVMAELMPKLKGKADGILVSNIVKSLLGG